MARTLQVSDSVVVDAPAALLYDMISDLTRMGEWSPENQGATVLDPAPDGRAFVGMRFDGVNRRGGVRWVTRGTVTAAEPGRHFAFRIHAIGVRAPRIRARNASWGYRFEPADAGATRVVETWHDDRRWPRVALAVFDRIVTRGSTFPDFQRRNIARTLRRFAAAAEDAARG